MGSLQVRFTSQQTKGPWPNQAVSGSTPQLVSPDRHRIAIDHIATSVDAKYFDKLDRGATRSY